MFALFQRGKQFSLHPSRLDYVEYPPKSPWLKPRPNSRPTSRQELDIFAYKTNTQQSPATSTYSSRMDTPTPQYRESGSTSSKILISDSQIWKAMELAVLCAEYGK